jgi:GT2 family glycosyltransferase
VVIPTLGRHELLGGVLDRLERQSVGSSAFEVVVVADARASGVDRIRSLAASRPYPARALVAARAGASAARNHGWGAAQAPLVLFLGDDVLPGEALVAEHLDWHTRHPDPGTGVLGHVEWSRELRVTPFMRWLEQGIQSSYATIDGREAGWWHFYTTNASLKRELLDRAGGFDEEIPFLYEDTDLAKRMHSLGFRLLYNSAARAEHHHPSTLEDWRGRMALIAAAEHRFCRKHPDSDPYFLNLFREAQRRPRATTAGARLARYVPRRFPWLGTRVWASARGHYLQELAPAFMEAWAAAEEEDRGPAGERRGDSPHGPFAGGSAAPPEGTARATADRPDDTA